MVDLVFKSIDIQNHRSKFTDEAFSVMTKHFPNEPKENLARFLIARNGNVDKAVPFLQKCLEWRSENLPLKTSSFYKEYIKGKIYIHGEDKSGHPLIGESLHSSCFCCTLSSRPHQLYSSTLAVYRGKLNFAKEREIGKKLNLSAFLQSP